MSVGNYYSLGDVFYEVEAHLGVCDFGNQLGKRLVDEVLYEFILFHVRFHAFEVLTGYHEKS